MAGKGRKRKLSKRELTQSRDAEGSEGGAAEERQQSPGKVFLWKRERKR